MRCYARETLISDDGSGQVREEDKALKTSANVGFRS